MDKFTTRLFQSEVELQCKFVLGSSTGLGHALNQRDVDGTWFYLQGILVSAANISKLLWGSSSDPQERIQTENDRQNLRRSIHVTKKSPLHSRRVRNAFEHVDVELAKVAPPQNYVGRNIGPPTAIRGVRGKRFGNFDPSTGLVTFWRYSTNVRTIITEVNRILPLVQAELRKPL